MPLYHVQDSDRPMWVVAKDWAAAIAQWKTLIAAENDGESDEPEGIQHVCDDVDLIVWGFAPLPLTRHPDDQEFAEPTPEVLRALSDFSKGDKMYDGERREITALRPSDDGQYLLAQFYHDDSEWYDVQVSEIWNQNSTSILTATR